MEVAIYPNKHMPMTAAQKMTIQKQQNLVLIQPD